MPLRFLLDENISHVVADQVKHHRQSITIESVHTWRNGAFRGRTDRKLMLAAAMETLTLVTYDLRTIPPLLIELDAAQLHHSGVIFVDDATIANNDFGTMTRALVLYWDQSGDLDWEDRIDFLSKSPSV